jgi:hypothetical protein
MTSRQLELSTVGPGMPLLGLDAESQPLDVSDERSQTGGKLHEAATSSWRGTFAFACFRQRGRVPVHAGGAIASREQRSLKG